MGGYKWLMDQRRMSGKFFFVIEIKCFSFSGILIKFKAEILAVIKITPHINSLQIYRKISSSCQNCHNFQQIVFMMLFIVS